MSQTQAQARALADRLCRAQRIGVFGHRGVGKTTFLTMLYREAVGGRVPEMRLAAADAGTAEYLADKILQLEAGQPLPATLAETDLQFHLYSQNNRLDLLLKDYQGEHVAVGRQEPIRDFLRDCDAVWLCLDVTVATVPVSCLRAQQEVEQLVEDYLAAQPTGTPHRPMALILTKADLLSGPNSTAITTLVQDRLGMTRHALSVHCPQKAILAVSSLGQPLHPGENVQEKFQPRPVGLDEPLIWLAKSLQEQDEARLEQIWQLRPNDIGLLQRCVACFTRRYPESPAARRCIVRFRRLRQRTWSRRAVTAGALLLALILALWGYDALGWRQLLRFGENHGEDPADTLQQWRAFGRWHPTRHLFVSDAAHIERAWIDLLSRRVREKQCEQQLAALRRQADDPDASPEAVWQQFEAFQSEFPERSIDGAHQEFRNALKERRDAERERQAVQACDELLRKEALADLATQISTAEKFLSDYPDSKKAGDIRQRLGMYLRRVEEQAIQAARLYSSRYPFNFQTRLESYGTYLQHYPKGTFVEEARNSQAAIGREWDSHDFRKVRDHFQDKPGEMKELEVLCRAYLAGQPSGQYSESATALLRWIERIRGDGEYRVTIKSGSFDPKSAQYFSRGLNLSVELEVNGVAYGPSTIVKRSAEPEWNYPFPRLIKWKIGDKVRIRVIDHYFWRRTLLDVTSEEGDLLSMKLLSGALSSGKNSLVFESDFGMPVLPRIE